jgi:uncharacterized protein (TIGR00369 family)
MPRRVAGEICRKLKGQMETFKTLNPRYEEQGRAAFARQAIMTTMGARLVGIAPGRVEIELDFREDLTQHHGYLHAGVVTTIVDSACGFAAFTLMPPDSGVLTVEYKVNFLSPARGSKFLASGRVIKPGRTLTVCAGEVSAIDGDETRLVAVMQATMFRLRETSAD